MDVLDDQGMTVTPRGRERPRCDNECGQESYVFAWLNSGHEVSYCYHHGTLYLEKLREVAVDIVDERHLLKSRG